jgi:hypothetical protein
MLKPVAAFAFLAASVSALAAPAPTPVAQWTLAGGDRGCAVHASSPGGTVVSIVAGAGQDQLMFLVQNPGWSLRDGERTTIAVAFDGSGPWQLPAVARTNIDSDGHGLVFAVPLSEERGNQFINQFVAAKGMQFSRDGRSISSVPLGSGQSAMTALAQCLGKVMSGETPNVTEAGFGGGRAVKI